MITTNDLIRVIGKTGFWLVNQRHDDWARLYDAKVPVKVTDTRLLRRDRVQYKVEPIGKDAEGAVWISRADFSYV